MKRKSLVLLLFISVFVFMFPTASFADILHFGGGNNYSEGNVKPSSTVNKYYNFSLNDQERINKGDLQVRVVMDVLDTDRGTFWDADDVEFILYDNYGNELYSRSESNYDPHSDDSGCSAVWDTGNKDIGSGTSQLRLYFKISADGDNDGGFNNIKLYFYDNGQPDIVKIVSADSGTKKIGDVASFQVVYDETVNVTGTPRILMNTNGYAYYDSGSGTNTLTFRYTAAEGDEAASLNYNTNPDAFELNGGTIKDPAGNAAKLSFINKTNTLYSANIKIDGKRPVISSITPSVSNNKKDSYGNSLKQLNGGDTVSMTVNFDEPVNVLGTAGSIKLRLNNGSYAVAQSTGNNITRLDFKYNVTSGDSDIDVLDVTELLEGTIKDLAGNDLNRAIKSIASAGISIDNTAPAVSFSENQNSTYQQLHSTVVAIADSGSGLSGETYKHFWSKDSNINNVNWSGISDEKPCEEELSISVNGVTGTYYLHIRAEDKAGNFGYNTSGAFSLDNQGPAASFSPAGSAYPNGDYAVTVSVSDALSPIDVGSIDYQWYKTAPESNNWIELSVSSMGVGTVTALDHGISNDLEGNGKWRLGIKGKDSLGNESIIESGEFLIDKLSPEITIVPDTNPDVYEKSHYGKVYPTDHNYYEGTDYVNGSCKWWYQWTDNDTAPDPDDADWIWSKGFPDFEQGSFSGLKWLQIKAEDNSGNVSIKSQQFKFDNEAPSITFITDGSEIVQGSVTAEISLSDAHSGIKEWFYQWSQDGLAIEGNWTATASYSFPLTDADGDWYLSVKAVDNAGNEAAAASKRFRLDNVPPAGSIDIVEVYTNTNIVDINLTANDTNYPDEIHYRISMDGGATWSSWNTFVSRLDNASIPDVEGTRKVQVQYRDKFNNESLIYEDTAVIDKTAPTAEITYSISNQWTAGNVTAVLGAIRDTYTEGETIVERDPFEVSLVNSDANITYDPISNKYTYVFSNNGRLNFTIRDKAGNEAVFSAMVNWIDKTEPYVIFTPGGQDSPSRTSATTVLVQDKVEFEGELVKAETPESIFYQWSKETSSPDVEGTGWVEAVNGTQIPIDGADGEWYLHIKASDSLGNTNVVRSSRFVLDNTPPNPTVTYSNTGRTANPVTASIEFDEPTTITKPSNGSNYYVFSENGEFTFEYVDASGNMSSEEVSVDWIDKSLPTAYVTYSATDWTNDNVTVTIEVYGEPKRELLDFSFPGALDYGFIFSDTEADGTVTEAVYELRENGSFSFVVRDCDTKIYDTVNILVNNIDKVPPYGEVIYSETEKTQDDIAVTILTGDNTNQSVRVIPPVEASVVDSGGSRSYLFTENGDYDFILEDVSGNQTILAVPINNIDRKAPAGTVVYTPDAWTNGSVTATAGADEEIEVLNNNGSAKYTFYENGSFIFRLRDTAGNISEVTAEVNWIDKIAPEGVLNYNASDRTNRDVEVVVEATDNSNEAVKVLHPEGTRVKEQNVSYMVPENGTYEFKLVDAAGNEETLRATINNIDKVLPEAEVNYSTKAPTNGNVEIRLTLSEEAEVIVPETLILIQRNGNVVYEAPDNGDYLFTLRDLAQNENTVTASVYNIDRVPPVGKVDYSTFTVTRGPVIATVTADEEFKVSNNFNLKEKAFNENGAYIFRIVDLAGNQSEVEARVTNIDNIPPEATVVYSSSDYTNNNVIASVTSNEDIVVFNNNGSRSFEFGQNGTFRFRVADLLGNETSVYANVSNIDKSPPLIDFSTENRLMLRMNEDYDLKDFTAYDLIDGYRSDLKESVIIDESGLDITKPGQYQVGYSVDDRAGNTTAVKRSVTVISPDAFRVFVNGLDSQLDSMVFDTSQLNISVINGQGDTQVKWKKGYLNQGSMKSMANVLPNTITEGAAEEGYVFNAPGTGYYTFYIQDQERNTALIRAFVGSVSSQGVK